MVGPVASVLKERQFTHPLVKHAPKQPWRRSRVGLNHQASLNGVTGNQCRNCKEEN